MKKIGLYSGRVVDPTHLRPGDVDIRDIAHHMARVEPYNGGLKANLYYLGEHALLCSEAVDQDDPRLCMAALMCKAHKVYLGDMARPLKASFRSYEEMEQVVAMTIGMQLGYSPTYGLVKVKAVSQAIRRLEMKRYTNYPRSEWEDLPTIEQAGIAMPEFKCYSWRRIRGDFLDRFEELKARINEDNDRRKRCETI